MSEELSRAQSGATKAELREVWGRPQSRGGSKQRRVRTSWNWSTLRHPPITLSIDANLPRMVPLLLCFGVSGKLLFWVLPNSNLEPLQGMDLENVVSSFATLA